MSWTVVALAYLGACNPLQPPARMGSHFVVAVQGVRRSFGALFDDHLGRCFDPFQRVAGARRAGVSGVDESPSVRFEVVRSAAA